MRAGARRRPPGHPARALGRRPGRPRRSVPAQGDRGGRGGPRQSSGRRGLRARRPDRAAARGAGILADAGVKAVVVAPSWLAAALRQALARTRPPAPPDRRGRPGAARTPSATSTADAAWDEVLADATPAPRPPTASPRRPRLHPLHLGLDRPAQGSDALARERLHVPRLVRPDVRRAPDDRFASHAPFHFDLSVFDLFASCRAAATLVVIGEALGKDPARLGPFLADDGRAVWYSAPSILALLAEHGGLDRPGPAQPRGSSCSRARSSRSPPCGGSARSGPRPTSGTSTGRPRPTSARRCRSRRRFPTTAPSRSRSARSARPCGRGWSTTRAATSPRGPSASW